MEPCVLEQNKIYGDGIGEESVEKGFLALDNDGGSQWPPCDSRKAGRRLF